MNNAMILKLRRKWRHLQARTIIIRHCAKFQMTKSTTIKGMTLTVPPQCNIFLLNQQTHLEQLRTLSVFGRQSGKRKTRLATPIRNLRCKYQPGADSIASPTENKCIINSQSTQLQVYHYMWLVSKWISLKMDFSIKMNVVCPLQLFFQNEGSLNESPKFCCAQCVNGKGKSHELRVLSKCRLSIRLQQLLILWDALQKRLDIPI